MSSNSIVFDLDHTLCIPNHEFSDSERRYSLATPITDMIEKVNLLHDRGWEITIHTSRRMVTHNGDIEKIIEDVGYITKRWLEENGVKYHKLQFGKPYSSSHYVDDKAITPQEFLKKF